ncbi:electron transfer flavoprotein subunit beta [candidate division KSB3 bacterium]|uniref:Electron transfer flavoprotein subunit beta n=1 Tax=candidate division KSB3 bacterium TaxID=2044937 RepID=A0A2G6KCX1_9BACT|nr:MAG: electron transfer flavoprotein subunit beta [candidate division KSB3 bacterium]
MEYKIIVLVKQVPDTQNITGEAMKEDGTVNRAALPAIFNPEDLNALEEAIKIKEQYGGTVTVITMGPPNATEVLRSSLFRGADRVILLSDRKFAGADTLATSYALCLAIKKLGDYDIVLCGRQAIDGDTAQVGPQTAEKLGINQMTCVDKIVDIKNRTITTERSIEGGFEVVKAKLPILLTITDEANTPRPPSAKKVLAYKHAVTTAEYNNYDDEYLRSAEIEKTQAIIQLWDHQEIGATLEKCGLSGSPTKVKQIESVVLEAGAFKNIENSTSGLETLLKELMDEHIIG